SWPKTKAETALDRQSVVFSSLLGNFGFILRCTRMLCNRRAQMPVFDDLLPNKALAIELL
ncbi:MAG: hypothetical protein VYC82_09965, partial [Verrucomicrobiota bacterium]|nr:hypothetical protein [Verrucomicrobiota bacterium]